MATLDFLPHGERLLSGTISALLSAAAKTIAVSNPPDGTKLPTYFEIDPDSTDDRETVRVVAVSGGTITIERGVYDGGVGKEHQNNAPYKQKITQNHWEKTIEAISSGYLLEDESATLAQTDSDTFTITLTGVDRTTFYTPGRRIRINGSVYATVKSSSYLSNVTTVNTHETTVPASITSLELEIAPKSAHTRYIHDINGNEVAEFEETTSAVNHFGAKNSITGAGVLIQPKGDDSNIDQLIKGKGTGVVKIGDGELTFPETDGSSGQVLKTDGSGALSFGEAGASFWNDVPGTPTRVSDTQFTITDTSNANLYDLLFKKGTILKWMESTTFQTAMVISSSYGTNTVTVNIVGDSLTAGFTGMKYAANMAQCETFIIPGTLAALTDAAKTWYTPCPAYFLSADLYVKTAGTGTGSNIIDINDDGTTKWTTKPTVTTGTSDLDNVADNPSTAVAEGSIITLDIDAVTATTAAVEAYVYLWWYPQSWQYRS